jgi:glycosyltransferase involved in cell wall biosynthesis
LRGLYRAYLAAATRVIAVSEKTREDVLRFYPVDPERVDVIHHATNPDTFYEERDDEGLKRLAERWGFREPYLLFVGGRISFYKNFDGLAAGYARSKCRDDVQLVVAGKKWLPEEEELLARLGLGDRVRLVENPDDDDLRRLYNHAVAYVFPSLHEGFGIPLLEAMACGTPVLAADTAVFREVAGAAALYFDPYDPDAIAAALEAVLDPAVRSRLIGLGRDRLRQFSWDKAARQTEQVYLRARAEFQGR